MSATLKALRAIADPTRVRILALLAQEELSVAELQEISGLAQSRISTHLGQLSDTGLVVSRRDGKRTYYRFAVHGRGALGGCLALIAQAAAELPEHPSDSLNLQRALARRRDLAQLHFNQVAGRFDRSYGPGRSWQALGQVLLRLLPPLVVADLGSGEGLVAELLARNCHKVIAIDNSEKIIEFAARRARNSGIGNLEFRLGDIEAPPIEAGTVDAAILSQALHHAQSPSKAVTAAARILRPGGCLVALDLARHRFEQARELYGDQWLGFEQAELHRWFSEAGLEEVEVISVAREEEPPQFETLLAMGQKPK